MSTGHNILTGDYSKISKTGQMLTSLEKMVEWFALQTNVQGGQVLATSGAVLQSVNGLVSLGETGSTYFQPSMAGFLQQTCFDQDYNITASAAAAAGFANHNLPFGSDAPNSQGNKAGDWTNSATANYNLPEYGATNNHDNIFNNVVGAGLLPTGSSLEANPEASFMFDAANGHENDGDLLLHGHATGSCSAHARKQFLAYVEKAKTTGWLDSSFHYGNSINSKENGAGQ